MGFGHDEWMGNDWLRDHVKPLFEALEIERPHHETNEQLQAIRRLIDSLTRQRDSVCFFCTTSTMTC